MNRLLKEFAQYRVQISIVLVLGLVVAIIQPVCVKLSQGIIDQLKEGVDEAYLRTVPLMIMGIFGLSGVAKYFYNTLRRNVSERVILSLRAKLFEKYLYLPMASIKGKRAGEMLSSIQNDLVQINVGLDTLCDVLKEPFTFVGLIGVAFYCDWKLTLCTLLVAPLVVFFFSYCGAAVKRYSARNLRNFSDLVSLGQESIVGTQVVKVFNLETTLLNKFRSIQNTFFKTLWKSIRVQELATPAVEFIGASLMAAVLIYGGFQISSGEMTSGKLVAFLLALGLAQMPIKKLNNAYLKIKGAEAAAERIFENLDVSTEHVMAVGSKRIFGINNEITYEGVGLSYGKKLALIDISFTIRAGECVAFVGQSGSGKSSLVNLLPRLYDATQGKILIDGVDIRTFNVEDLRQLVSVVTQDVFLFNDSIYENIRYGNLKAERKQIVEAANLAHCEFISRFPEGFQTKIGDRGGMLSGGERQRIAIARAILKGAPLLILDEATSNLDSHSEALVQKALETLMVDKTTLMIAHRFSTVRRADRIYVMERGHIKEHGNHGALMAEQGIYRSLFDSQILEPI